MLQYNAPTWQSTAGADKRGDYILKGAEGFTQGITGGLEAVAEKLDETRKAKQENEYLTGIIGAQTEAILKLPDGADLLQKFETGGLKQRQGLATGIMARLHEQTEQALPNKRHALDVEKFNYSKTPEARLPIPFTTPGGGTGMVAANGGVHPESDFLPEVPELGEWRPRADGSPDHEYHWTPKRGFTGAMGPKGVKGGLPLLSFGVDAQTGKSGYFDMNGDMVDHTKLLDTEEIPGTARPSMHVPMPPIPGVPGIHRVEVPGSPAQRRLKPQPPADANKPPATRDFRGPDGVAVTHQWDPINKRWVIMDGNILMNQPGDPTAGPLSGQSILDALK